MRMRVCGTKIIATDAAPRSDPPEPLTLEELGDRVAQDTRLRNASWSSPAPNPAAANVRDWNALKHLNELNKRFWERH
jgi:hypothetical protein